MVVGRRGGGKWVRVWFFIRGICIWNFEVYTGVAVIRVRATRRLHDGGSLSEWRGLGECRSEWRGLVLRRVVGGGGLCECGGRGYSCECW